MSESDLRLRILDLLNRAGKPVDFFTLVKQLGVEDFAVAKELHILIYEREFVRIAETDLAPSYEITPDGMDELKLLKGQSDEV